MSDLSAPFKNLLPIFNCLPGAYLLLSADLIIEAASDAYLEATLTRRENLIGHFLFEVFPDNPLTPEANSVKNLRYSLEKVLATGKPHQMACQHYDVPDPDKPSQFVERYWLPRNTPVLDNQGQVQYIIHDAINVTENIQADRLLQESQTREQKAQAEAKKQQQQLHNIFMAAPAMICIFEGPQHVFKLVNPPYQQLVGNRPLLGMPIAEAMPELIGQPIIRWLDEVYRTGNSFNALETLVQLDHGNTGKLGENYYNFIYQATRDVDGNIDGILVFAYEVTVQVQARQQIENSHQHEQNLNEELQAINKKLQSTNEELNAANTELIRTQEALQQLNEDLEARVAKRTQQVRSAQAATEAQRIRLERFFQQAPAAICVLDGPDLIFELVNSAFQQLFPGRSLLGKPVLVGLPEIVDQPIAVILKKVFESGETFEGHETLITLARHENEPLEDLFFNFIYQARYNENGDIDGILVFAFEVTEQVRARQQTEALQAQVLAGIQSLANERETFYQIFEQTPAAISIMRGPEHRYEYLNDAYQQLFPERQLKGRTIVEALPEAVKGGFLNLLDKVYQTGEAYFGYEMPLTIEQPDGTPPKVTYFTFTYQAYREKGEIEGISIFAYDVTAQVLAHKKVEETAQQLKLITDSLPVLIGYLDKEEKYRFANRAYEDWFNQKPEELLGRTVREVVGEKAYRNVKSHIDRALAGERLDFEEKMPYRDNFLKYVRLTYVPDSRDGEVQGFYIMVNDITDQVLARQEAERQRQMLQTLFMEAPAPIVILDGLDLVYQLVNPAYQQIFPGRNLLNKPLLEALPELAGTPLITTLNEVYQTGKTHSAQEMLLMMARYEGGPLEEIYWTFTYQARRNEQGIIDGAMVFAYEVTDQVKARRVVEENEQQAQKMAKMLAAANEELRLTNEQLIRTNVDLDNFIYTASHDLKAPILNIEGLMEALLDDLPPNVLQTESVQFTTGLILNSVQRFKRTINHLTEITKLQKEHSPGTSKVNLAEIIAEVQLDIAPLIKETQAKITLDVTPESYIRFSEKNLRSIVYNLLSNAIKFHSPERVPHVVVRYHETDGYQVLTVKDNGLGMDLNQEHKLFAMFKRLHDHVAGSGIGLYMVKKIIENAGGKIEVQSKVDEGSTFRIYFRLNT